jgi:hypothetical protein
MDWSTLERYLVRLVDIGRLLSILEATGGFDVDVNRLNHERDEIVYMLKKTWIESKL